MRHRLLALFSLFFLSHCRCVPVGPPPGRATCESVCAHLSEMGCEAALPTAKGASCATVCGNAVSTGWAAWDLECMAEAKTCEGADSCE